jgi:thiol-disulfide isomerase/thioredoxin
MGGIAAISLTLLLSGAAPAEHLRVWVHDLDDCCAPKAVAALGALPAVSAISLELADGALCLTLASPAAEALPVLTEALTAAQMPVLRSAPATDCPAAAVVDPWAGAAGFDFAKIPSDKPFSMKSALVADKVTVIDFGAAWCAPCHAVAAALTEGLRAEPRLAVRAVLLEGADANASFATPVAKQHLSAAPGIPWMFVYSPRGRLLYAGEDPAKALAAARGAL